MDFYRVLAFFEYFDISDKQFVLNIIKNPVGDEAETLAVYTLNARKDLEDFYKNLNYLIRKAYHVRVSWDVIYYRHIEIGRYENKKDMFFDKLVYITTAFKEGKVLDDHSLNNYVFDYLESNQFRIDKIKAVLE